MNRSHGIKSAACGMALVWSAILASTSTASGDNQQFLDSLREREMYDEALDLLGKLRGAPDTPAEFRERIDYEAAVTLLERARRAPAADEARGADCRQAVKQFDRFLADHPDHGLAARAQLERANALVELGRIQLAARDAAPPGDAKATKAATAARRFFERAMACFRGVEQDRREQLERFAKVVDDPEQIALRDQLRRDYLVAKLSIGTLQYEIAGTLEPGSPQHQRQLRLSASTFEDIYTKYRARLAGLYGRLYQARAVRELGQTDEAIAMLNEVLELPDEPSPFATLKAKAVRLILEIYVSPEAEDLGAAVELGNEWLAGAGEPRHADSDQLAIRFLAAQAAARLASAAEAAERTRLRGRAIEFLAPVAKYPGEFSEPARKLLSSLDVEPPKLRDKGPVD